MRHLLAIAAGLVCSAGSCLAQQVTVSSPSTTVGHSFSENIGVNFGLNFGNGAFFRMGGGAPPAAGNFDPNAGAQFGFGIGGSGFGGSFNITAGQGSQRSLVGSAPTVTLTNGVPGFVSDTTQQPFVIGVIPVVGGIHSPVVSPPLFPAPQMMPEPISPLKLRLAQLAAEGEKLGAPPAKRRPAAQPVPRDRRNPVNRRVAHARASTAGQAALSVAEIRRRSAAHESSKDQAVADELQAIIDRARASAEEGKAGAARVYYQMAIRRADDALKDTLIEEFRALPNR